MYQNVDENAPEADDETATDISNAKSRTHILIAVLIGVGLLAFVTLNSLSGPQMDARDQSVNADQRETYLKAISAPTPALRRARLTDFIRVYPKHPSRLSAQAQLQVLEAKEAADWATATDIIYDPEADRVSQLIALEQYSRTWGPDLLGGRDAEIARLRAKLAPPIDTKEPDAAEPTPDFTPRGQTVFAETVRGDTLVGGTIARPRGTYIPPTPAPRREVSVIRPGIRQPEIRKNVTPRYPSRALRRNIEAVVTLSLFIDDDGDVEMTELVSVSARKYRKDFIRAAERAALRTKFHPKMVNGRAVPTRGVIKRYRFTLEN